MLRSRSAVAALAALAPLTVAGLTGSATAQLGPVPVPAENPITEAKRVLGKALFWDAQLSSDNSTACGTCHVMATASAEPFPADHPGPDGIFGSPDDVRGSIGVTRANASGGFVADLIFGFDAQVTSRTAQPVTMAAFSPELFWDGRASGAFVDPQTDEVVMSRGGALETQALGPVLSDVEMAHEERDWDAVTTKLAGARPLALATNVPPDVAAVLTSETRYPELFNDAFGDDAVTARRIAFAIATYQRTLTPDQTPFDTGTMTQQQQQGLNVFLSPNSNCSACHSPPEFSDHTFRNIGVRPVAEDRGRQIVTGLNADRGRFKVPSLRNVGLKTTFMHNGEFTTLQEVLVHYNAGQFQQNIDPLIPPIAIPPQQRTQLQAFLAGALTDPRVATEAFPFDRPTLHTELEANPALIGAGAPGGGGFVPRMIAVSPPNIGNAEMSFGVSDALGGATAWIRLGRANAQRDGALDAYSVLGPITLNGSGLGAGFTTLSWSVPDDPRLMGDELYVQWEIEDPAAAGGRARSAIARLEFFRDDPAQCGCDGDVDCDGVVAFTDVISVLGTWGTCELCGTDRNDDGVVDLTDLLLVLSAWGACGDA